MNDATRGLPQACQVCGAPLPPTRVRNCSDACRRKRWEIANRDRRLAYYRERYQRVRDRARDLHRAWYVANRERALMVSRHWSAANRDRKNQHAENRRARIEGASGSVMITEWSRLLFMYAYACGYCGDWLTPLTADHRIPLSRGGAHDVTNLIPACLTCNLRKGSLTETEFRARLAAEKHDRGGGLAESAIAAATSNYGTPGHAWIN